MKWFSASNSVTRHVLGMLALISVLYLALAFVVLRFSVYASFAGLEADMVAEDARRVRQVLDGQFESLKGIAREWSAWDDTYEYLAGRNPQYADAYLFDGTLAASSVDVMAFLRPDGTPLWSRMIDLASGEPLTIAPLLSELGATQARFANRMQAGDAVSGVVSTPYGTVLIVALPVLRTDTSGPPAGTMVIGRLLTSTLVTSLASRVGVPFRAYDAGTIPPALAAAWRALSSTRAELHTETRDASVVSYQAVPDLWGKPAALLEAITPGRVISIGKESVFTALAMLMVGVGVFSLSLWWFLNRSVINPIRLLRNHVAALRTKDDLSRRVGWDRPDEIGALADAFDALAGHLQRSIDESELARAAAVSALQARSDFLARMSHEIRTPMNGVLGMTSIMLQSDELDDEQRRGLETIFHSGRSLLAIIDDILDLAKIEAGKVELVVESADLRQIVEDCVSLLQSIATQSELVVRVELDAALAPAYLADPQRVRQVLTNLVGNAVKFTPSGQVVVSVDARPAGVRFTVADTGVGIRPENLRKVFDSFAQEDSGRSRRFGGTGLGLTISKQLVDMMGGTIGVQSEPGVGSTFWFELPLIPVLTAVRPLHQASLRTSAGRVPPAAFAPGRRVLVVEDNPVNRRVAHMMLEKLSCHVTLATNGAEAVQAAARQAFDLVLMDCEMPVLDGYEAARRLRAREAAQRLPGTPIVALTANVLPEDRQRCLDAGMNDVLTKPITLDRLSACLSAYFVDDALRSGAGT